MNDTTAPAAQSFVITKEYRRFEEFCAACRRYHYIGLCYGPPGVGKTLSAHYYARWDVLGPVLKRRGGEATQRHTLQDCRTLVYTPTVANHPNQIARDVANLRVRLTLLINELTPHDGEAPLWSADVDPTELLIVDEADRLKLAGLEQIRDIYDRGPLGVILIGMPGLEKRLARYGQLYSRVGFVHPFRSLSDAEVRFILQEKWAELGLELDISDFTDSEALAAIVRITGGNFRLLQRLFTQIERILQINELRVVTKEVVETAREGLVIGPL
jgi:DNA transposition AAA+ family ATPase